VKGRESPIPKSVSVAVDWQFFFFALPARRAAEFSEGGSMKSQRVISIALFTMLLLLLGAAPALAQSDRGTITGTVTDPNGAAVPNAKVTAINLNSN
jgi:hypothetical protein